MEDVRALPLVVALKMVHIMLHQFQVNVQVIQSILAKLTHQLKTQKCQMVSTMIGLMEVYTDKDKI